MRNSRLVYSTDFGRACPDCDRPVDKCRGTCRKSTVKPAGDGIVRVRREKQGRKGKTVTTISGLPLSEDGLRELASQLKRHCGAGGSIKDGVIVIQGDHCDALIPVIQKQGYTVKRSGG